MTTGWRTGLRWCGGLLVLAVVVLQTGTGPFLHGLRSLEVGTLVLGVAIAVPATLACAVRWRLVARGLGLDLDLGPAVAACYRAQFLNSTLPGGVVGDVHRGLSHGRAAGEAGRGLRAVWWERAAGQVVFAAISLTVLVLLPSPVRAMALLTVGLLTAGALVIFACRTVTSAPSAVRAPRLLSAAQEDVRRGLLPPAVWPKVMLASAVAAAGHVTTFLVAARATGVVASWSTLVPLALIVLLAAALPLNVAGWGPREGMSAWGFGAAGLGVDHGVATAVAYGASVLVASLPGLVVLVAGTARRPPLASAGAHPGRRGHG